MAIHYTVIPKYSIGEKKVTKFYACARSIGQVVTDDLCEEATKISTVHGADLHASLYALGDMLRSHLAEGHVVRLDEIGSFSVAIASEGEERKEDVDAHSIKNARIVFKPSKKLSRFLRTLTFKKIV